jgi:hypothetical protein
MQTPKSRRKAEAGKHKAGAAEAASAVDPGRKATADEAYRANIEAIEIIERIKPLNLASAAELIRQMKPSAAAIASLPFILLSLPRKGSPRNRDALASVILAILLRDPDANTAQVLVELRDLEGTRIIEKVFDDGSVRWFEGEQGTTTPKDEIAKRVSRARQKIRTYGAEVLSGAPTLQQLSV